MPQRVIGRTGGAASQIAATSPISARPIRVSVSVSVSPALRAGPDEEVVVVPSGADIAPREKVGRVTSFGAFCGNIGGMAIVKVAGLVLMAGLGYLPLFLFASISYLLAVGWIHLLLPEIRRAPGAGGLAVGH